jgi:cytochrome c peroxidase
MTRTYRAWPSFVFLFAPTGLTGCGPRAHADPGDVSQTLATPMEVPIEIEIELSPAGSLKQAPLWKELVQMLEDPYSPVERRPGFGVVMPELDVWPLDYNFLTAQPMRLRTSDGEVSWDQPGPLFDPDEVPLVDEFNTPLELRSIVGHLVALRADPIYDGADVPPDWIDALLEEGVPEGSLVVFNPDDNAVIPPDGTVVAVPAYFDGALHEYDPATGEYEELFELEQPVNEEHFFRDPDDTMGVPRSLRPLIGRPAAELLGKALFWDMQVGSDGVQACGTCHFHAGVDNRSKNQLNPGHLGGDLVLDLFDNRAVPPDDPQDNNQDVTPEDFPFHKRLDPDVPGDGLNDDGTINIAVVSSDANDVLSSMGVLFHEFVDIPTPGGGTGSDAFLQVPGPVKPLAPDIGDRVEDPVPMMQDLRRVEGRNTPTFHGAAFNFDNFWDGRARFHFNGGSVVGPSDPTFHVFVNDGTRRGRMHGLEDPEDNELPLDQWRSEDEPLPVRIKFSSLASQAVGPPLSEFEMSFFGRNWQKIGKKLLQTGVTPLANQLVHPDDSVLGPYSNDPLPGLELTYRQLIQLAFDRRLWANGVAHFEGEPSDDPFDGYVLEGPVRGAADPADTNEFTQMEANFSLFFGLAIQSYEQLTIPDDTPADRFFDANPRAGEGVGEPGDQAVLFPTLVPDLLDDGLLNNSAETPTAGQLTLIPDDPSTPEYDGFGPDEVFGFDVFAGANLTAGLPAGTTRNPLHTIITEDGEELEIAVGSNPFTRSAKCMLCHLGAEQTDHSINIAHGLLKNDAEFEYPTPPVTPDPSSPTVFSDGLVPAPEPSGRARTVQGLILSEEVSEGAAQDAVEVEPRGFAIFDDDATPWDDSVVAQASNFAFGDQGVYNIGLRPNAEDIGRGGGDLFEWPLSLASLTLMNIGGPDFEPNDDPTESNAMADFDPYDLFLFFEETGDGAVYPGTSHTLQSVNPGYERDPIVPLMPEYMAPWLHALPAGEAHPVIDEMAGMVPNTLTTPNGGPAIEFGEVLFGADLHCALYDPDQFGSGPPHFGWGAPDQDGSGERSRCPQNQSGVAGNMLFPVHGTWPVPNRVLREGAFKAPPLRNVELTGPYFHTGSFLTLRQVVDFYFRGGDFPVTNEDSRDPNITDVVMQSFSFGRTSGDDLLAPVSHVFSTSPPFTLAGTFADALPDPQFVYDELPDVDHPISPEYATVEDVKDALVKFLLALTDPRVRYARAPFDHPEIFVPIDGTAPLNTDGPDALRDDERFRHVAAVGEDGNLAGPDGVNGTEDDAPTPFLPFLGISSAPVAGDNNDHFDPQPMGL